MKTTNTCKTKPNKAWFRSSFTPCGQDMDQACSTAPGPAWGSMKWGGPQETLCLRCLRAINT